MKRKLFLTAVIFLFLVSLFSCGPSGEKKSGGSFADQPNKSIMKTHFGTIDGKEVFLFSLKNKNGLNVKITNYGAIITSILTPDRQGKMGDIVLGYDSLQEYVKNSPYFGAIVGRYANRIAKGQFTLDGTTYQLAKNNGENHLHGGIKGFDKVVWNAEEQKDSSSVGLKLSYHSKDGEENYPGNLETTVLYTLTDQDELMIAIQATTDKACPVNLTNHSYFNLTCADSSILGHELLIFADRYTVVDNALIPTGELRKVAKTPMDFSTPYTVGSRIDEVPGGYDHNYVLEKKEPGITLAAKLYEPLSGRALDVYTSQPGIQFYSGNFLDGSITGKNGKKYLKHYGLCLETQHFPDSPNHPEFPDVILKPGQIYQQATIFKFSIR